MTSSASGFAAPQVPGFSEHVIPSPPGLPLTHSSQQKSNTQTTRTRRTATMVPAVRRARRPQHVPGGRGSSRCRSMR